MLPGTQRTYTSMVKLADGGRPYRTAAVGFRDADDVVYANRNPRATIRQTQSDARRGVMT
jgi:hypothetical protein